MAMLGQILVEAGDASTEQLEAALAEQRETRERVGLILVRQGLDPEAVARALARQLRLGYAPPPLDPDPGAAALLTRPHALRLRMVPLSLEGRTLRTATADPLDAGALDDFQFRTGRRAEPVVAAPGTIDRGLAAAYGEAAVRQVLGRLQAGEDGDADALRQESEAPPIIALVDLILDRAVSVGASDIHIEPDRGRVRVRGRVDGVLRELVELPAAAGPAVTSRIKIMAGLDIAVKRRPQDGRSSIVVEDTRVSIRVSTLPAQDGEKVVLRLLDPRSARRSLGSLGMGPTVQEPLGAVLGREHGLFLVTGPTGSGKTTTLYAVLESRDRERRNVITG